MNNKKTKKSLHPIMTFLILICIILIISGVLYLLDFSQTLYTINATTLEYSVSTVTVQNLFSFEGLKYIFSSTVANFVSFAPLSTLIIVLMGFGVMEKSGFLKTAITALTKKMKRNTVTFLLVFISIIASVLGDLSYIVLLPLSALVFKYGKRNPLIGVVASFAGLTCGQGLSVIFTSVDSSLLSLSLTSARVIDMGYRMASISAIFIMAVAVLVLTYVLTMLTEKKVAPKLNKYEVAEVLEEDESVLTKRELRGLIFSLFAGAIYILIFIYNIIPGLPLSGKLLDNSQVLYVDKLFSYNSFFSNGFVFIVTSFFVILGLFYGLGARTINNHQDFVDTLGHSLDNIGKTLVLIFFASTFISLFKYTNIGNVLVAFLANLFSKTSFQGVPLIIMLFVVSAIATLLLPNSVTKWSILSPVVIPVFMNAGMTPEFCQIIFRFGESATMGLTPMLAYFVIYLAILNDYCKKENSISIIEAIKIQTPYAIATGVILLCLTILWYVIGLPTGINGATIL